MTLKLLTAAVASAFLAVAILHVRDSHFAMTDILMTLLVWCSLCMLLDALAAQAVTRACAAAGLLAGLAASTKYSAAAGAASMVVVLCTYFWAGSRARRKMYCCTS